MEDMPFGHLMPSPQRPRESPDSLLSDAEFQVQEPGGFPQECTCLRQ